ncbi:hypothetical protein KOW79_006954 [Hemibagrus wyckioides]|uniref:Uncharacterized protein n=1 Tax=Hemibagrus wyckioides TaxID=337641 RepID=A0A9D3NU80_9TELE|nr:hypothetical protein KOW79_006954 [Hemibagrus wyckioides]
MELAGFSPRPRSERMKPRPTARVAAQTESGELIKPEPKDPHVPTCCSGAGCWTEAGPSVFSVVTAMQNVLMKRKHKCFLAGAETHPSATQPGQDEARNIRARPPRLKYPRRRNPDNSQDTQGLLFITADLKGKVPSGASEVRARLGSGPVR